MANSTDRQGNTKIRKFQLLIVSSFLQITPSSKVPLIIALAAITIKYLQILFFLFLPQFHYFWNSHTFVNGMTTILDYIHYSRSLRKASWQVYIASFYLHASVTALFVCCSIYIIYRQSVNKPQDAIAIIYARVACRLIADVMLLPVVDTILSINECSTSASGIVYMTYFDSVVCYQSVHLASCVVGIMTISMFVPLLIVYSMLFFEPMMNKGSPYHR